MKITIGLSLSLSGEYAAMGREAETSLRLFVADANANTALRFSLYAIVPLPIWEGVRG